MQKHEIELALKLKLTPTEIKKMLYNHAYWEKNADHFKSSHTVSWGDINLMNLEIKNISEFIKKNDLVLDAGCSNGFSTFEIARLRKVRMAAFDYSEKAIEIARRQQKKKDSRNKIDFFHCNILNIEKPSNTFDVVYTIRVIINLLSWRLQKQGILEVHRVLKHGGLYLMSEAFIGGLKNINKLRRMANLDALTTHDFNLYLNEKKIESFIKPYFDIVEIKKFSSIYYAASRFLRYLSMEKGQRDSFVNEFNNFFIKFHETENSGDFGVQKLYVLRKK